MRLQTHTGFFSAVIRGLSRTEDVLKIGKVFIGEERIIDFSQMDFERISVDVGVDSRKKEDCQTAKPAAKLVKELLMIDLGMSEEEINLIT